MEYTPPKPVSSWCDLQENLDYNYQGYVGGWNRIAWTEVRNRPRPPAPLNSKGRHLWKHALTIHQHAIEPCSDSRRDSREARLHRKGWTGLTTGLFSAWEYARILDYVNALGPDVYKMRLWKTERSDERPGDIGPFPSQSRSYYFAKPEQRQGLIDLITGFPQRTVELYVPDDWEENEQFAPAVTGLNWHVFEGEDGNVLTVEPGISNTALMALRMFVSCPPPAV